MSAQPHEPEPVAHPRPEPTIRSVRAALPAEQRPAFNEEIERTPLHEITRVLADWDLRARALAAPEFLQTAQRIHEERAGLRPRPRMMSDEQLLSLAAELRPNLG
ncbi:hypothetical protein [Peterkaempfera griseoplana]|uniref:hypothetical protein n=1 Tax=Peterkaempfera griseoplana TaxID=66896 RepID=UPI000AE280B9|nr:hypothetical protein [Peterkaempfera griseoplana]